MAGGPAAVRRLVRDAPACRVLITGVSVPARPGAMEKVLAWLASSGRHEVTTAVIPMAPQGKFDNVNDALARVDRPLSDFDWILVTDDDIAGAPGFLDSFLAVAHFADLQLVQPAHAFRSYAWFKSTQRRWGALAHGAHFVEIGPLTAIRRDVAAELIPFPQSRWAYGLDAVWADLAARRGWRLGVVDATPIQHLSPVAGGYSREDAIKEARELLARHGVTTPRADMMRSSLVIRPAAAPR